MITQLLAHSGSSNRLNPCICALDVAYNTPVFITLRNISNDCLDDAASSSSSSFERRDVFSKYLFCSKLSRTSLDAWINCLMINILLASPANTLISVAPFRRLCRSTMFCSSIECRILTRSSAVPPSHLVEERVCIFCKKLCKLTDRIRNKNSPNIINLSLK